MAGPSKYLVVHNVHNGEQIKIPKPIRFVSMAKLKSYLVESFTDHIIGSIDNVFLLTSFGIKLELSVANDMSEAFLFDKQLFQKSFDERILDRYSKRTDPQSYSSLQPKEFRLPTIQAQPKPDIRKISSTLELYHKWASTVISEYRQMEERTDKLVRELNVIFMGINIIFNFASNFTSSAEKFFRNHYSFVKSLATKSLSKSWTSHYSTLKAFPEVQFQNSRTIRLQELLSQDELSEAAEYVTQNLPSLVSTFNDLSQKMNEVTEGKLRADKIIESLRQESSNSFKQSESKKLASRTEFDRLVKCFNADMSGLSTTETESLLEIYQRQIEVCNALSETSRELFTTLDSLHQFKKKLVSESCSIFESIALQQMKSVEVRSACKNIVSPVSNEDTNIQHQRLLKVKSCEDLLSMTVDLPLLMGFVMIEKRRQYEWHDFFSRGIVTNVTEQLTNIIENEREFQQLWNKKFGKLIGHIHRDVNLSPKVPAIDVTLVNSNKSGDSESIFGWLGEFNVEREDLTRYIETIKTYKFPNNARFHSLLTKNFNDLVASTEKLKQMTKSISSLGSQVQNDDVISSQVQSLMSPRADNVDQDSELNLIHGFRTRIKKLEDLLHQKQFKDLNAWPVVKSARGDERMSLLLTDQKGSRTADRRRSSTDDYFRSKQSPGQGVASSDKFDEERNHQTHETEELTKQVDALRKELEEQSKKHQAEIQAITEKNEEDLREQKESAAEAKQLHESRYSDLEKELESVRKENSDLKVKTKELEEALSAKAAQCETHEELEEEITNLNAKLSDEKNVQGDLLSNLHAKENDFVKERIELQSQLKDLNAKLDEKNDDFENLMEVVQSKQHTTDELVSSLNDSIKGLFQGLMKLMESNIAYFRDFCLVLESMGLLLVQQTNSETGTLEYRIKRVKGLRSRKDSAENDDEADQESLRSVVVNEVQEKCKWMNTLQESLHSSSQNNQEQEVSNRLNKTATHETDDVEAEAKALVSLYETYVHSTGEQRSKLDSFLSMISFKENVQFQEHDPEFPQHKETFFSNGIIKRFNIVEGFAKKLTKENKNKSVELAKALKTSSDKIAVKDFQVGDLVLFLPTKLDSMGDKVARDKTPWSAFNMDAPHYFLDPASLTEAVQPKEYILSRVVDLYEHSVTSENVNNAEHNPYSLSVGTTWYTMTIN